MCILSNPLPDVAAAPEPTPARLLNSTTRQQRALDALAGQPITTLANQQQVSRKFVYQQLHHAHDALDQAFNPADTHPPQLLFWLPVTKPWLRQYGGPRCLDQNRANREVDSPSGCHA